MWIRYTKEEYDELVSMISGKGICLNDFAKWIKKIVDAADEEEQYGRKV